MVKYVGLWIDDHEAVIVTLQNGREETRKIFAVVEKPIHVRTTKRPIPTLAAIGSGNDVLSDQQPADPQHVYYDGIISLIRDSESILIFGPGSAKGELEERLRHADLGLRIVGNESADQMTIPQISAKVTSHFFKN